MCVFAFFVPLPPQQREIADGRARKSDARPDDLARRRGCAGRPRGGRDGRAGSARSARPASPCRCRRSADQKACGKRSGAIGARSSRSASSWPKKSRASRGCGVSSKRSDSGGASPLSRRHAAPACVRAGVEQPVADASQIASATSSSGCARIDDGAALGIGRRDREKGLAQSLVEGEPRLRTDRRPLPRRAARAARRRPTSAGRSRIRVRSGCGSRRCNALERIQEAANRARRRRPDRRASNRRNGRRRPICRRRAPADRDVDMIDPRRGEKDCLGRRAKRLDDAREQDIAQNFGARRAARLARRDRLDAARLQGAQRGSAIWVDLPAPSPPSSVMKVPRCGSRAFGTAHFFNTYLRNTAAYSRPASIARRGNDPGPKGRVSTADRGLRRTAEDLQPRDLLAGRNRCHQRALIDDAARELVVAVARNKNLRIGASRQAASELSCRHRLGRADDLASG